MKNEINTNLRSRNCAETLKVGVSATRKPSTIIRLSNIASMSSALLSEYAKRSVLMKDVLLTFIKTQKTICKHLLEEEYSRTVANDPTFAAQVNLGAQLKIDH